MKIREIREGKARAPEREGSAVSKPRRRLVVLHAYYGCDTGCCGHWVGVPDEWFETYAPSGNGSFQFDHPNGEDFRAFAEELIRELYGEEHVADLDWENCRIVDTC